MTILACFNLGIKYRISPFISFVPVINIFRRVLPDAYEFLSLNYYIAHQSNFNTYFLSTIQIIMFKNLEQAYIKLLYSIYYVTDTVLLMSNQGLSQWKIS